MTGVAFHRGGRLLMALHLRPWKVLMKSLNVRKSLGVATALSLSLLGSLSSAAIASADETPDPSDSASVSAPADPSEGVDQSDVDDATPSDEASEDQGDVDDATPSDEASEDPGEDDTHLPEADMNFSFSIGGKELKSGSAVKIDLSNRTLRVNYSFAVPEKFHGYKQTIVSDRAFWVIVPSGTDADPLASDVEGKVTNIEDLPYEDTHNTFKGSFDISLDKLELNKHYDLFIDFAYVRSAEQGVMGRKPSMERVTLKDFQLTTDASAENSDKKSDSKVNDETDASFKDQTSEQVASTDKAGSELTNGSGVAAGDKVGLPATGF